MYSFGSVSSVGSWFCISVTRSSRKSLAEMVAEPESELLELLLLVEPEPEVELESSGASVCPAVIA